MNTELRRSLKQGNVSKDDAKAKVRLQSIWKRLNKSERNEIIKTAGISAFTMGRICRDGKLSLRVVVAFSHIYGIDPLYLIGQTDECRAYERSHIAAYLKELGYAADIRSFTASPTSPRYAEFVEMFGGVATVTESDTEHDEDEEIDEPAPEQEEKAKDTTVGRTKTTPTEPAKATRAARKKPTKNMRKPKAQSKEPINKKAPKPTEKPAVMTFMAEVADFMSPDVQNRANRLSHDELLTLLQSLSLQAEFSEEKKSRLTIVKSLLLM